MVNSGWKNDGQGHQHQADEVQEARDAKTAVPLQKAKQYQTGSDDATEGTPSLTNWIDFQSDDDSVYTPSSTVTLWETI